MDTTVPQVKEASRRSSSVSPVAAATTGRPVSAAHNHGAPAEQRLYRVCRVAGVACMKVCASTSIFTRGFAGSSADLDDQRAKLASVQGLVRSPILGARQLRRTLRVARRIFRLRCLPAWKLSWGSCSWTRGPDDYPLRHRNGGCCGSLAEEAQPKGVLRASQQPIVVSRGAERGSVRHAGTGHDGEQC